MCLPLVVTGTVSLDWDDNSETDLAGYTVYRSTTSGSGYAQLDTTAAGTSEYSDDNVTNGTTYYYIVTAMDTAFNESVSSDEVAVTPGVLTISLTLQENDSGFCTVDGDIESEHTGYTGDGYANTDNAAENGIDYSIEILASGTYLFVFRYAGISDRPADLIINDVTEVSGIDFPSTGAWTSWDTTAPVTVTLTAGIKTVRLEATGSDGCGNIDSLEIAGVNLQAADCL